MELRRWHSIDSVRNFSGIGYREIAEEIMMRADNQYEIPSSLKRNILVATRQYAKRQLTWFAREPKLQQVMLTGNQVLRTADAAHGSIPSLL